jgi:hypothetical protein
VGVLLYEDAYYQSRNVGGMLSDIAVGMTVDDPGETTIENHVV